MMVPSEVNPKIAGAHLNQYHPVKQMIRGLGPQNLLNIFSNCKWVRSPPWSNESRTPHSEEPRFPERCVDVVEFSPLYSVFVSIFKYFLYFTLLVRSLLIFFIKLY